MCLGEWDRSSAWGSGTTTVCSVLRRDIWGLGVGVWGWGGVPKDAETSTPPSAESRRQFWPHVRNPHSSYKVKNEQIYSFLSWISFLNISIVPSFLSVLWNCLWFYGVWLRCAINFRLIGLVWSPMTSYLHQPCSFILKSNKLRTRHGWLTTLSVLSGFYHFLFFYFLVI